jgi:fucose permease
LDSTYAAHIMPGMILLGLGIGGVMTTAFQGATSGLHRDDTGVASALINSAVIAAFLIPNRALEPSEGEPVMAH